MKRYKFLLAAFFMFLLQAASASAQQPPWWEGFSHGIKLSNQDFVDNFDFVRREAMIPMRDGVKLYTIVLIPKGEGKMPILLTRTPYGASVRSTPEQRPRLEDVLVGGDDIFADSGYIRVFQDIRGRNRSEGEYVVTRPLIGPYNSTRVDHSTDTYDTIDWLLNNIPQTNRRVGMIGTSYDGFLVLMGLVNPHPAMKAAVPINPMVDGWKGDDWFHNGAFRQMALDFLKLHILPSSEKTNFRGDIKDDYDLFLQEDSAGAMGRRMGIDSLDFWKQLLGHPSYDMFWQSQAVDKILASQPLTVPTLHVHGLWDQEDIYGAIAVYQATEAKDIQNDRNFLAIGPWNHGGSSGGGSFLGPLKFGNSTGSWFRRNILLPFLNERLKEGSPKSDTPPVLTFETGTNTWHRYNAWPLSCDSGCEYTMKPLYLKQKFRLDFKQAGHESDGFDAYISDPLQPVPYRKRPIPPVFSPDSTWGRWLVDDQEIFSKREDVLSYQTDVLSHPVKIDGRPIADLFASTSGTDVDFIVKLIDVYPDPYPGQPELGDYQLMISADILRGRYRKDPANPSPVPAGIVERYRWALPAAIHVFLPGHRIMIQIQSSWFPLYDRNPQTYVENIFNAESGDFQKATQKIFRSGEYASSIELPVVNK
jgi:putative CocE/NonD family hydrolase